jgi:SsrA-binding protein
VTLEIVNRKARYDYFISETYEAGIVLKGTEIKSIRQGNANFNDAYVVIKNGEMLLLNMFIASYNEGNIFNHDERRTRKLLMHKKEILKTDDRLKKQANAIVPLKLYFKNNKAKILIGIATGKKKQDKRETIKRRDQEREINRVIKTNNLM